MERLLLEAMYEVPGRDPRVDAVVVDESTVRGDEGVALISGVDAANEWLAANDTMHGTRERTTHDDDVPAASVG